MNQPDPHRNPRNPIIDLIACVVLLLCFCSNRAWSAQGGGFARGGLLGNWYANTNLSGTPAFTRRDVRLDFGLNDLAPGGAGRVGDIAFRSVPPTNFSAQWTGQLIARFSEPYTFKVLAHDTFRLRLRPAGLSSWTTVIEQPMDLNAETNGVYPLSAGRLYDVEATLTHSGGPWAAQLRTSFRRASMT